VTGAVDPDRIWANAGARAGDRLILTKWLGTGIVGTAIKKGRAPDDLVAHAVRSMTMLNRTGARVLRQFGAAVHGATDITGFGLIGHAAEMAKASGGVIAIDTSRLPLLPGVRAIAAQNRSGGLGTNREHFESLVTADRVDQTVVDICYDPQTSGGLLAAVDAASADAIAGALADADVPAAIVGDVRAGAPHILLR
jgi:selenide,water dikinase